MTKIQDPRGALFSERVKEVIGRIGSVAKTARITGIATSTVSRMRLGSNEVSVLIVATFCEKLEVSMDWLLGVADADQPTESGLATPEFVTIELLDLPAAAGAGTRADVAHAETKFPFSCYFLQRLLGEYAPHARLKAVRAKGKSMEPLITDGALLIIDETRNKLSDVPPQSKLLPRNSDLFVFISSEGLRLKRLRRINQDSVAIISENDKFDRVQYFDLLSDGTFKIIGRVIWWDNRL